MGVDPHAAQTPGQQEAVAGAAGDLASGTAERILGLLGGLSALGLLLLGSFTDQLGYFQGSQFICVPGQLLRVVLFVWQLRTHRDYR